MSIGVINIVLMCLAGVLVAGENVLEPAESRIVKGRAINITDAPFMVQLRNATGTICGGILLTLEHVLTAGHCFLIDHYTNITVVGGADRRNDVGVQRKIIEFSRHPNFKIFIGKNGNFEGIANDIAVLKLNESFVLGPTIKPHEQICSRKLKVNETMKVYGWGVKTKITHNSTVEDETNYSDELRTFTTVIKSKNHCRDMLNVTGIPRTSACAFKKHRDACISDSGGPGMRKGELCALVSWGNGCAYRTYPSVYTNLYELRDFINETLTS